MRLKLNTLLLTFALVLALAGADSQVDGGARNTASSGASQVSGGDDNTASSLWAQVSGGHNNTAGHVRSQVSGMSFQSTTAADQVLP